MKWTVQANKITAAWACGGLLLIVVGLLGGCEQKPGAPAQDDMDVNGTTTAPEDTSTATPKGMDAEDHPDAPRALPRSSEAQGWIKIKAAEAVPADQLAEFVEDPAAQRLLAPFKFKQFARATYQSPHAKAELLLAQSQTPEDALGAFSAATGGATCTVREDGSLRASQDSDGKLVLIAWQGTTLVRLVGTLEREGGQRDCERLLSRTLFGLPTAEPPLLMRAVKEVSQEACKFWIVRSSRQLAEQPNPRLRQVDPAVLDARLGLTGDVLLSVVAVEQTLGSPPIILWLVEYPTPADASAAAVRYTQAVDSEPKGLDTVTFVGSAKGTFLMGTWTTDQATARDLVKMLEEALPTPVTARTQPS